MARIDRDRPKVRLALVVTAANAAQIIGIAIVATIGVLIDNDSFGLFVVASITGYAGYLFVGLRALKSVVDSQYSKALIVAPVAAFALWMLLNDYVPGIEWTPLLFPYLFVIGTAVYMERKQRPSSGSRFR